MPPRASLTSSFSITDPSNEVVCPLHNQDGSGCRKRCVGDKRYRSMQEHIRRAHSTFYIGKLPATKESVELMFSGASADAAAASASTAAAAIAVAATARDDFAPATPRNADEYQGGALFPVAAALAQLHSNNINNSNSNSGAGKMDSGWETDGVSPVAPCDNSLATAVPSSSAAYSQPYAPFQDWLSDKDGGGRMPRSSIELPPIHLTNADATSGPFPGLDPARHGDTLPSIRSTSPPGRSSTLPPLQRHLGPNRPRKQSITKKGHHQRKKSKGATADWLRRLQNDGNPDLLRPGHHNDRKALSAEPPGEFGKRWADLIDAAASATEDIDEDRTPVSLQFPASSKPPSVLLLDPRLTQAAVAANPPQMPQSPVSVHRASLPPFPQSSIFNASTAANSYQASPLQQQQTITPPLYNHHHSIGAVGGVGNDGSHMPEMGSGGEPFPSVESSGGSADHFHMEARGLLSDSSPTYHSSQNTQIYCAACQSVSLLRESYACTECICGLCQACVDVLMGEQGARRKCPRCATIGGRFKPFQLDIR